MGRNSVATRREILTYLNIKPEAWQTAKQLAGEIGDDEAIARSAADQLVAANKILRRASDTSDDVTEYRISSRGIDAVERPWRLRELFPIITPILALALALRSLTVAGSQAEIVAAAYRDDHQPQLSLKCDVESKHRGLANALTISHEPSGTTLSKIVNELHVKSPFVGDAAFQLGCVLANRGRGGAQEIQLEFEAHYARGSNAPDIACERVLVPPLSAPFDLPAGQKIVFSLHNRSSAWLAYQAPSYAVGSRDGHRVEVPVIVEGSGGYLSPAPPISVGAAFNLHGFVQRQVQADAGHPNAACETTVRVP